MTDDAPAPPVLRIVRGIPADQDGALEVAVLTAVLAARSGEPDAVAAPVSAWNPPERRVRPPVVPSSDGWRLSGLPR